MINWHQVILIFHKELIDVLRDRRTLFAMIVLPLLIYPVIFFGFSQVMSIQMTKLAKEKAKVALVGKEYAPALADSLQASEKLEIVENAEYKAALEKGDIQAAIVIPDTFQTAIDSGRSAEVALYVDLANDKSRSAQSKIDSVIQNYKNNIITKRLETEGLDPNFAHPIKEEVENVASAKKMGGFIFGRIIPAILLVIMLTGAFYPAVDLTAGEKERGTMATILVSPTERVNIVLGKFLTVFLACMITALLNLLSMGLTFAYGISMMGEAGDQINFAIGPVTTLVVLILTIPLGLMFSALAMGISTMARSYKEAQNYLTPLMMAALLPSYASLVPGRELNFPMVIIPVANVSLLMRDVLLGQWEWEAVVISIVSTLCLAWPAMIFATKLFNSEEILFNAGEEFSFSFNLKEWLQPPEEWKSFPTAVQAVTLVFMGLLVLFYVAVPLQRWNLDIGLLLTQVVLILGLTLFFLYKNGIHWKTGLAFRKPPLLAMILPIFIVPSLMIIISELMYYQNLYFPLPEEFIEAMKKLGGSPETAMGWVWLIFLGAFLPGVCEEVMFRGFALSGFRQSMKPGWAIVVVAIAFGLFHLSFYRFMPTALIGLVLGYLTIRTGSIFPAMLAHFLNNAVSFTLLHIPGVEKISWLMEEGERIPLPVLAGAIVIFVVSVMVIPRGHLDTSSQYTLDILKNPK